MRQGFRCGVCARGGRRAFPVYIFCIWTALSRNVCLRMMFFFFGSKGGHTHRGAAACTYQQSNTAGAGSVVLTCSLLRCVPGEARRRGGLGRSERLQACRGARCSVSGWAAGGVCARRRDEARGRLLLRGAGCIVERSACTWCCMLCVQAG